MKIAQVAPIWTSIPPKGYGGAEKILSLLTEGLVQKDHDVTLFATGDSKTNAKLVSVVHDAPGLSKDSQLSIVNNMNHLFNMFLAMEKNSEFDLIHWHISKDLAPMMFAHNIKTPSVITIHNHFYLHEEMPLLAPIMDHYKKFPNFVSISNFHRRFFPFNFLATVYNGINLNEFEFNQSPEDYMVWVGRFEYQKGAHLAIQAAIRLKRKLKLAAPKNENDYFYSEIAPHLDNEYIEYLGEIDSIARNQLLKNARVFLNSIQWDEPFGLVVPESNACGTPVVAYQHGAMSELINEGVNGFLINNDNFEQFINKIEAVYSMAENDYLRLRSNCRETVEKRFTSQIMVDNYEKVYQNIIEK